jgi:tRNA pseudouridine38-40 synthase
MTRFRATLEYDGTEFEGFQRQADGHRTVQGEVEAALRRIGWQGSSILAAGRTDTGVHATGQVIAFDHDWRHDATALARAMNVHLPADVSVRAVAVAVESFHPRYRALARRYRYTIYQTPHRQALRDRTAWHVADALDLDALRAASASLIGRKDFATFGTDPDHGDNTVRNVQVAEWTQANTADVLFFDIQADAFLFRMVRSLVGALKRVGDGASSPDVFVALLEARDRALCPPVAPARGLCLIDVVYPP